MHYTILFWILYYYFNKKRFIVYLSDGWISTDLQYNLKESRKLDKYMSFNQVLKYLVQKAEETSIGINKTLTINWPVIVGELISSNNYYDFMSGFSRY